MDKYLARDMSNRDFIIEMVMDVVIALVVLIGTENWFYFFCFCAYSRIHYRFNVAKSRQLEILSEIQKIKDRLEIED